MDEALPAILLETAARVLTANRAIGKRIVLAESCTGGLVTAALTAIAGSSDVLECGFVTYSNESKMRMLGVDATLLETFGAVSIATAWSMAQGALDRSAADVAVSITGIAGPDGGCAQKPVGTVVVARARRGAPPEDIVADIKQFGDLGRTEIRVQTALVALELLMPVPAP